MLPSSARASAAPLSAALLAAAILFLGPPRAAAAGAEPLSLDAAVSRALSHNATLGARECALSAATWSHRQAIAQLLPSLAFESLYTRLDDETVRRANVFGREFTMYFPDSTGTPQPFTIEIPQTVFRDGYRTSISAQLLLLRPEIWNAVALAGAAQDLAGAQLAAARQEIAHQTLRAFIDLLKIRSLSRIQREHLARARENLAQADRLLAVGRYAEADVLRWRVEEARESGLLIQQENAERLASLSLENLIGEIPQGTICADTLLPPALRTELAHCRALDTAAWAARMSQPIEPEIAAHPQLRILDLALRAAQLEHRQSLTRFLPGLTVAGSYGWESNDTPELDGVKAWSVSAILSLPLFSSGANYSARQATKWRLSQTRAEIEAGRRALLVAAAAARTAVRSYAEQLRLAETNRLSARRNYEIRENSFALGRLSNLEWLDAQLARLSAEQTYTAAYYDLILALADLRAATGALMEWFPQ